MAIENKITTLRSPTSLTEQEIQAHFDEQNALGYYLIAIDNISGWYRFFWQKTI